MRSRQRDRDHRADDRDGQRARADRTGCRRARPRERASARPDRRAARRSAGRRRARAARRSSESPTWPGYSMRARIARRTRPASDGRCRSSGSVDREDAAPPVASVVRRAEPVVGQRARTETSRRSLSSPAPPPRGRPSAPPSAAPSPRIQRRPHSSASRKNVAHSTSERPLM